jgi:hypothetical protein
MCNTKPLAFWQSQKPTTTRYNRHGSKAFMVLIFDYHLMRFHEPDGFVPTVF